jgi:hypothetical protein
MAHGSATRNPTGIATEQSLRTGGDLDGVFFFSPATAGLTVLDDGQRYALDHWYALDRRLRLSGCTDRRTLRLLIARDNDDKTCCERCDAHAPSVTPVPFFWTETGPAHIVPADSANLACGHWGRRGLFAGFRFGVLGRRCDSNLVFCDPELFAAIALLRIGATIGERVIDLCAHCA